MLFVGKAQEKTTAFRTEKRRNPETGESLPVDRAGHGHGQPLLLLLRRPGLRPVLHQVLLVLPLQRASCASTATSGPSARRREAGIAFEALDNGFSSCEDPARLQRICDRLSPAKIDASARKWLARLPHPFTAADRRAGYRYDISILQAEFSLTQVLDRPLTGRVFFEEVIRDNLDLGRPDQVVLDLRAARQPAHAGAISHPGHHRGRHPSLHVDYKHSRIKQYHKEGQALRTETTVNDARDFGIGKRLHNLPALREIGFTANRRLLDVQRTSCDCHIGEDAFDRVCAPVVVDGQRAPALRFGDPRVQALLSVLVVFRLLPDGFSNRDLRAHLAPLLGIDPAP